MNGNFRSPSLVKRYEYAYYDLQVPLNTIVANAAVQRTDNYRYIFVVDNSSEANPNDWYNAYFEVEFKLNKTAAGTNYVGNDDTAANRCTTTNGHFIKKIRVLCNSITVYDNSRANEFSNILALLNYTLQEYVDSVGIDQFFYLDQNPGAAQPDTTEDTYDAGFAARKRKTDGGETVQIYTVKYLFIFCRIQT